MLRKWLSHGAIYRERHDGRAFDIFDAMPSDGILISHYIFAEHACYRPPATDDISRGF